VHKEHEQKASPLPLPLPLPPPPFRTDFFLFFRVDCLTEDARFFCGVEQIVNIVTCDSEVGSGTVDAAGGKMFSPVVPLPVAGVDFAMGMPLEGLAENVETVRLPNPFFF
jgi:hypothetical protein